MHKLVVLYPTPDDPDHFREYYENTHLPLAATLPGLLDWRHSLSINADPQSPYFAVFEGDFADAAPHGPIATPVAGSRSLRGPAKCAGRHADLLAERAREVGGVGVAP